MAQVYKIDNKRYDFIEVDSLSQTTYLISEADYNKWIKVKTDDSSVNIELPEGLSNGFRCVIENTGVFTINYVNEAGTTVATQQDKFTEDQFRTIEAVYDNSVWRLQGYIGRQDLSSLFDVNVDIAGLPIDGDTLVYDINFNVWRAGKNVPFIPTTPFFLDHIIVEEDHGKVLLFDTTAAGITVTFNLGLSDGFYTTIVNVGTGTLNIATAGTLNAAGTSLSQYQNMNILHAGGDVFYGVISDGVGSSGGAGGGGGFAAGNYFDTFIATSYTGLFPTTHQTTSNSVVIGSQASSLANGQVIFGVNATGDGLYDIAIGDQADCDGGASEKISIGRLSTARNSQAIAIGVNTDASGASSVAIGSGASVTAVNSVQLSGGTNNEPSTLNFRNTRVAHNFGLNIPFYSAENSTTTTQTFAEETADGGVAQHPTLSTIALSVPNNILYIGTSTVDNPGQPQRQWIPINTPPNLDYIEWDIDDLTLVNVGGSVFFKEGHVTPIWALQPDGAADNINNEQWVSTEFFDASATANVGNIVYRRYVQNEPYFREDPASAAGLGPDWLDGLYARWALSSNATGFNSASNGPFQIPAAELTSLSSNLQIGDRVLFAGQTDNTENSIYRLDSFDGSFYTFNRPEDLQLGTAINTVPIKVWGPHSNQGAFTPTSTTTVGSALDLTFFSSVFPVTDARLYFTINAPGNYHFKARLLLNAITTVTNVDARCELRLMYLDTNSNLERAYDLWRYNLYAKNSAGADILNDIRLDETLKITQKGTYFFTLVFYDTPDIFLHSPSSNDIYSNSFITVTPTQLFEAAI